jgi:hypothetical protein
MFLGRRVEVGLWQWHRTISQISCKDLRSCMKFIGKAWVKLWSKRQLNGEYLDRTIVTFHNSCMNMNKQNRANDARDMDSRESEIIKMTTLVSRLGRQDLDSGINGGS